MVSAVSRLQHYVIESDAESKWWNSLSRKDQAAYLKKHPDSRFNPANRYKEHEKAAEEAKRRNENLQKAREAAAKKREEDKKQKEAAKKAEEEKKGEAKTKSEKSANPKDQKSEEKPKEVPLTSPSDAEGKTPDPEEQELTPVGEDKPESDDSEDDATEDLTHGEAPMTTKEFESPAVQEALAPKSSTLKTVSQAIGKGAAKTAGFLLSEKPFVEGFHAVRAIADAANEGISKGAHTTVEVAEAMRALLKVGVAVAGLSGAMPLAVAGAGLGVGAALTLNPVAAAGALALLFGATKLAGHSVDLLTASLHVFEASELDAIMAEYNHLIEASRSKEPPKVKIGPVKGLSKLSDKEALRVVINQFAEHLHDGDFPPDQMRKLFSIKRRAGKRKAKDGMKNKEQRKRAAAG